MEKKKEKLKVLPTPSISPLKRGRTKVAIAMSGGVDSSVAAKLLLDQGYEVVGFMMKLWSEGDLRVEETPSNSPLSRERENACCDIKGVEDARRVANRLNIPFYLIDAREEFKKHVVDYFIEEYKNLRTPNPCVVCNEKIKFGWLLDFAKKAGCDFLATGHYARIIVDKKQEARNKKQTNNNLTIQQFNNLTSYHLLKAKDENKDQSYFLYNLDQDQLSKIIFPIGQFTKPEVRAMAKKWGLPVHEKKESQEICFVKEKDFREFLHRHIPKELFKSGDIVNSEGIVLGKHDGLINYTIGQRRGVEQSSKLETLPRRQAGRNSKQILNSKLESKNKTPLYVVGYNIEKNQLIVGEDKEIYLKEMAVGEIHWVSKISQQLTINSKRLGVKIRYRHPAVSCSLVTHDSLLITQFNEPQRAITPGQSAVFYLPRAKSKGDGEEVLGGGIIES